MNWFQQIKAVFRAPSADVLAVIELESARRDLLSAQSGQEYATAMVQYASDRVARLTQITREAAR